VTNLDASPFLGRLALCRVHGGTHPQGSAGRLVPTDGSIDKVKVTELLMTEALERVPAEEAGPGTSSPWPASRRS
jgi:predicted membrane GTPase involved in stress response